MFAQAQAVRLDFDLTRRGAPIATDLFGIFFEEINHGGEGGLYGEAIVNRSFDDDWGSFYGWTSQNANISLERDNLLNSAQRNACRVQFNSASAYLRNSGFGGIRIARADTYKVSLWVRCPGGTFDGRLTARLVNAAGSSCGAVTFDGPFTGQWRKLTGEIRPTTDATGGAFQLQVSAPTTLVVDMVSCFPPTFRDRENGMRRDLGQMLADMHPRFMRFPGGCYIEGRTGWDRDPNNSTRWEWKKTIGPIEERPGHRNQQWGYWVSDGQGYHEFLQFCEDIGAAPMFVCNVGMGHGWVVDYRNIGDFIQETLDAIEYANGDVTTTYGALRAKNGHPEPFNLKYVEIGNENCNFDFNSNSDQSDHYFERYIQFFNAIKARFPEVTTIANVEAWGTDFPSWRSGHPVELVDEHYYRDAGFYFNNYEKYNSYSRAGTHVYVGEYAANIGTGIGNLRDALAEAVFMQGLENNCDVVSMASFAPIFMNETYGGWNYDIIRFDHRQAYGTPSYYVQKLFACNQGSHQLPWTETNNVPQLATGDRHIGIGTWLTAATFSDVQLSRPDGTVLFSQASSNSAAWARGSGTWAFSTSDIRQTGTSVEGATFICRLDLPNDSIDLSLKATKTGGTEGFLILFNYKDAQNYTWWNIGGWGNSAHGLENAIGGVKTTVARAAGSLETDRTYDIRIEKRGSHVRCYLDGQLIHDTEIPAGYARGVFTSAAIDEDEQRVIVKLTNPNPADQTVQLCFAGATPETVSAEVLTSGGLYDENTMSNPTRVVPRTTDAARIATLATNGAGGEPAVGVTYDAPANSLTILTIAFSSLPERYVPDMPEPAVTYSFERGRAVSDDGRFSGRLVSGATIQTMADGNHVLYSGALGSHGFMNLGTDMPRAVLADADDFTISLDLYPRAENNLGSFCWALAFANGTNQYFGFINAGGARDWYAELKDGSTQSFRSGSCLRAASWHNLTYVHRNGTGTFYIDGYRYAEARTDIVLRSFLDNINGCYIARSPFAADAYMENTYFDNLRIYDRALNVEQVSVIAGQTAALLADFQPIDMPTAISELFATPQNGDQQSTSSSHQAIDIMGRSVSISSVTRPGLYIINGRKVLVK